MSQLSYRIDCSDPNRHTVAVVLEFAVEGARVSPNDPSGLVVFQPTWTPGSYLLREFSRQLGRVVAEDAATASPVPCRKVTKNRWVLLPAPGTERVRLRYSVYARELTVRTADVTAEHAFWNHACLLLWPLGVQEADVCIEISHPPGWQLASALPVIGTSAGTTTLVARSLDQVIDSPCLLGQFDRLEWTSAGVPHAIVLDGLAGVKPPATLVADLSKIVAEAAAVFGGSLPYPAYVFLCLFAADGHGGLEHAASTTLQVGRTAWTSPAGYREFLGLAAHELFHAWNVKRMRPAEFWTYDYEQENYTSLLWLIEGWTAYYDDLVCHRAGLISREDYFAVVAKNVNAMLTGQGRRHSSLEESSFDAWIRLYRPDENTRNSSQNYYGNGAVAAMCLDLHIRGSTADVRSLDDVVRGLYTSTYGQGRGYTMLDVVRVVREVAGESASSLLATLVQGPLDPDLSAAMGVVGLRLKMKDTDKPYLGITFASGSTTVAATAMDSPAHAAGLSPGDEVLAVGRLRVDGARWPEIFQSVAKVGEPIEVLVARRGVIAQVVATPGGSPGTVSLEIDDTASAKQVAQRDRWLASAVAPVAPAPASLPPSAP